MDQSQVQESILAMCETSGDIPVYSLHRIRRLMATKPTGLGTIDSLLVRGLMLGNKEFRYSTNKDWNCLTSSNLIYAIEQFGEFIEKIIRSNVPDQPAESEVWQRLQAQKELLMISVRDWFAGNYDELLYDTTCKIPWLVLQRLRTDLASWTSKAANPFSVNIHDMIMEIAKRENIPGASRMDAAEAWEAMGGTLYTI